MSSITTPTKKEAYLVEGMTCNGCERAIQTVIKNLEGVFASKADLKTSSLFVEYNPQKVTIDQIKAAVNKLGYKIVGEPPPLGQREGSDEAIS